jgi:PAS domain S-box-containing protein
MQVFTSAIVFGLGIAAFVIINIKGFKNRKVISANTIAEVIGSNSISAIEFLDNDAAKKNLSGLKVQTDILNATILDEKGTVFASYTRSGSDTAFRFFIPAMDAKEFLFTKQYLFVYNKIKKENSTIGLVCIRFELSELNKIKMDIYRLGAVLLLAGIGISFLIAVFTKRYISKPLFNLVTVMQKVKDNADYKIRAVVEGKDEISMLSLGFNNMLENIDKSKQQLNEQNTLLQYVLQNMGDGLMVAEKNGKIIILNTTAEKMFGKELRDIPKMKWAEAYGFFLPDTQTPFKMHELPIVRSLNGEDVDNIEMFVRNQEVPEGLFIMATARPLKDPSGEVTGGVVVFHDITELKNAEKEVKKLNEELEQKVIERTTQLAEARQFMDTIVQNIPSMISVKDAKQLTFISLNKVGEKLLGHSEKELLGKTDYDIFTKEEADFFVNRDKAALIKGDIVDIPEELIDTKYGKRWLHTQKITIKDEKNNPIYLLGISQDITENREIERLEDEAHKLVRNNELKLNLILENIGEGVIVADNNEKIILANSMAEEIIGIKQDLTSSSAIDWSNKYDLYYPDEKTIFPAQNLPLEKALKGEVTENIEIIIEDHETKTKKRVIISGRPIIDENNYIMAAVATIRDVTQYKKLEEALKESEMKYRTLIGFRKK